METKQQVNVIDVRRKVSGQGNEYFVLDVLETLSVIDEKGAYITRAWNNLYFKTEQPQHEVLALKGKEAEINMNFYPLQRKVGENIYHDIKANILDIKEAKK